MKAFDCTIWLNLAGVVFFSLVGALEKTHKVREDRNPDVYIRDLFRGSTILDDPCCLDLATVGWLYPRNECKRTVDEWVICTLFFGAR